MVKLVTAIVDNFKYFLVYYNNDLFHNLKLIGKSFIVL